MHALNTVDKSHRRVRDWVGVGAVQERMLRAVLRRQSPSEPWVDAQFKDMIDIDRRGRSVVRRVHQPHVFPPGGAQTAMICCPICRIFTPPGGFENGVCLDHAEHDSWGPSPSAAAIQGLQYRNLRMTEAALPPESAEALQQEIRQHQKKKAAGDPR